MCGTPRITNFIVGFSRPSRFSRINPCDRISVGFSSCASAGLNSATNNGSLAGRVAMNGGSIVKLLFAGWHVPQVRPLPLNVSLKKRFAPCEISLSSLTEPPDRSADSVRTNRGEDGVAGSVKRANCGRGPPRPGGPGIGPSDANSSVSAARSGTSAKRLGGCVGSSKRTAPVLSFTRLKRLKKTKLQRTAVIMMIQLTPLGVMVRWRLSFASTRSLLAKPTASARSIA